MTKTAICLFVLSITVFLTSIKLSNRNNAINQQITVDVSSLENQITSLKQELRRLQAELNNANQGYEEKRHASLSAVSMPKAKSSDEAELSGDAKVENQEFAKTLDAMMQAKTFSDWLSQNSIQDPNFDYVAKMKERFDSMPFDSSDTVLERQVSLNAFLLSDEMLSPFPLNTVVCKKRQCYVELLVNEHSNVNFIMQYLVDNVVNSAYLGVESITSLYKDKTTTLGLLLSTDV